MTFDEKVIKLVKERSNALSSKKGLLEAETNATEERDFNYRYLFGYDGDAGINDLISSYAMEMYTGTGRDFASPILRNNNDNDWRNRLILAVTIPGDGDIYLDSNANGVADKTINPASQWLNNNSDNGTTTGGLVALATAVDTANGTSASLYKDGRGSFASQPQAIAHRNSTQGTGLRGRRTENSEVYDVYVDPDTFWYVGQSGIDDPHYFNDPDRLNLLTALTSIINGITAYITQMESILPLISSITADGNQLFLDMDAKSDSHFVTSILGDPTDIETLKSSLETYRTQAQNYYNYFNQFSASDDISGQSGYNKTTFDSYINSGIPALTTNIKNALTNRSTSILSKLGTISSGLKKYRYFWVVENIKKPVSPLIILQSVAGALDDTQQAIDNANTALNLLFGDPDKYVGTPKLLSVSYNPVIHPVTFNVVTGRIHLIWSIIFFANKYKVYRKDITEGEIPSNDNWDETHFLEHHTEIDTDINAITGILYDESYEQDKTYIYRIQALDSNESPASPLSRMDSFDSKSLQSSIYDYLNELSFDSIIDGLISLSSEHELKKDNYIAILNLGYYRIAYINIDGSIQLESTSINIGPGTLAKAFGVIEA